MASKTVVASRSKQQDKIETLTREEVQGALQQVQDVVREGVGDLQDTLGNEFECLQGMVNDLSESIHESLGVSHDSANGPDSLADRLDRVEQVLAGWQWVNEAQYKAAAFQAFGGKAPLEAVIQHLEERAASESGASGADPFYGSMLELECNKKLLPRGFDTKKASKPERAAAILKVARAGHVAEMSGIDIATVARWYDEWLITQAQAEAA